MSPTNISVLIDIVDKHLYIFPLMKPKCAIYESTTELTQIEAKNMKKVHTRDWSHSTGGQVIVFIVTVTVY